MDNDIVELSNLNRQRFYIKDVGKNKAVSLRPGTCSQSVSPRPRSAYPLRLQEAIARRIDLSCDVAICGVDNNPARVTASRYFRAKSIPVIFAAVSLGGDHGYVFAQQGAGPCLTCLFPDIANDDDRYPCPGTPAIADILQAVGALAVYAVDSLLMNRQRAWNYRRIHLPDIAFDGGCLVPLRPDCRNAH